MSLASNFWQRIRRRIRQVTSGGTTPPSSEYDTDATAFFLVNTGLTTPQKDAVNTLVLALKTASIWNRMIAIYPFIGGTAEAHKWNLKDPRNDDLAKRLVFMGTWVHSATGAKPDGSTAYAKTHINPFDDCPQYSFSGSYYSRENIAPGASGDYYLFGGGSSTNIKLEFYASNRIFSDLGHVSFSGSPITLNITGLTQFNGLFTVSSLWSTYMKIFRGSTQLGSQPATRYNYFQNTDPTSNAGRLYLAAYNNNETPTGFLQNQCAFASFGYGFDDTEIAALSAAVSNFQTTLGR